MSLGALLVAGDPLHPPPAYEAWIIAGAAMALGAGSAVATLPWRAPPPTAS